MVRHPILHLLLLMIIIVIHQGWVLVFLVCHPILHLLLMILIVLHQGWVLVLKDIRLLLILV